MTTFLLIRHGMTDSVGNTIVGRQPGVHLNALGLAQAERLTEFLRNVELSAVVSSPLDRTLETAQPIAASHALPVRRNDRFTEYDFGEWTGSTLDELDAYPEWRRFNELRAFARPPHGERMIDVQRRAVTALMELHCEHRTGTVAVVSHGDVIRAVLMYALGMPMDFVHRIDVAPGRISVIEVNGGAPRVVQMNADSPCIPVTLSEIPT